MAVTELRLQTLPADDLAAVAVSLSIAFFGPTPLKKAFKITTTMTVPATKGASSEARNSTALAVDVRFYHEFLCICGAFVRQSKLAHVATSKIRPG